MKTILRTLALATLAVTQAGCDWDGGAAGNGPAAAAQAGAQAPVHAGTLDVAVSVANARQPVPAGTLTALSAVPGVPAWSTTGGNPGHTNYVPASFDPAKFSHRFSWTLPAGAIVSQAQVALDGGQAFVVVSDTAGEWTLHAIDEATGKVNWTTALGKLDIVDPPAAHDGKVIVSTQAGSQGDALWFLDQRSGEVLDRQAMPSRHAPGHSTADMRMAPVVAGDGIYVNDRAAGKLVAKFDVSTHKLLWESTWSGSPIYTFAPAVDNGRVYAAFSDGGLLGFDAGSGATVLEHHRQFTDAPMPGMMTSEGVAYALSPNGVVATDLKQGSFKWQGPVLLDMAAPPGPVLYGVAHDAVQAVERATGKTLWRMPLPSPAAVSNPILATKNLLFISNYPQNGSGTYAVDIATRKVVWTCAEGGWLSISPNGVLYITPFKGRITVVNLG